MKALSMALLLLATSAWAAAPAKARAALKDQQGRSIGEVTLEQTPNGVLIKGALENLPEGTRAIHLHEKGACQPPFESAGGHFAPRGERHGFLVTAGPHAGDLPNIHVGADGKASFELLTEQIRLSGKGNAVLDKDGTAVIVHAGPDDYKTDPAGNAGDRVACGVIKGSSE